MRKRTGGAHDGMYEGMNEIALSGTQGGERMGNAS